jgi:hypothetical protein
LCSFSQRTISFSNGKRHDFRLFKESDVRFKSGTEVLTDSGYQGIKKIHRNRSLPKKRTKKCPLTREERIENKKLSSQRVLNENVIGMLKRFKIIADKYRNKRKRFGLRFNLIAGIYNFELAL